MFRPNQDLVKLFLLSIRSEKLFLWGRSLYSFSIAFLAVTNISLAYICLITDYTSISKLTWIYNLNKINRLCNFVKIFEGPV